jgi:DNA polymerase IV
VAERRVIAHLDMDAFYVSVELLRHPELCGKPLIIAWNGPRSVVTTASYEARKFGVGSAMPASRARRLCPQGIYLPPDMSHYRDVSRKVMALIDELEVPNEQVSLDELYLDLSGVDFPVQTMTNLVRRIRDELGLDASVGIGPNKLVAKVASDAEKPRGFVMLSSEQAVERFADASPRLIPGIGPKTADRLREMGIETLAALRERPLDELRSRFGESHGHMLFERARFRDSGRVSEERVRKSQSVEGTFDVDISDAEELRKVLREQAERLGASVRKKDMAGRTIAIKVRLDDFSTITRARTIAEFTNDSDVIAEVALQLLAENPPPRPVRLLGVRIASFADEQPAKPPAGQMPSLLDAA